jgi:phospholipid N-methyltransferase
MRLALKQFINNSEAADHVRFLLTFLEDPKVAALTPVSRMGVKRVSQRIDFSRDIILVEYGPGDGVFTSYFLNRMTPGSRLILVETNPKFAEQLRQWDDSRIEVVEDSAEHIEQIMGGEQVDYVVSGIPFTYFKAERKHTIISGTAQVLKPKGKFLVYQYNPHTRPILKQYFNTLRADFEPFNLFPLFIFEARNDRN